MQRVTVASSEEWYKRSSSAITQLAALTPQEGIYVTWIDLLNVNCITFAS